MPLAPDREFVGRVAAMRLTWESLLSFGGKFFSSILPLAARRSHGSNSVWAYGYLPWILRRYFPHP